MVLSTEPDPDSVYISHHFMGGEHNQKCLFVAAPRQVIRERKELLAGVGLTPVCITGGRLEATYSCLFDDEFVQDDRHLLHIADEEAILFTLNHGVMADLDVIEHTGGSIDEIIEEAGTHMISNGVTQAATSSKHQLYVITEKNVDHVTSTRELGGHTFDIIPLQPLHSVKGKGEKPGSRFALCAGMAVKQLYPALDSINLLQEDEQRTTTEQIEKKDALNTGLIFGGSVAVVWLLILLVQFYYQSRLDAVTGQVRLLNDKITAVSDADSEMTYWTNRVEEARKLVSERTRFATLMEEVGRSLPRAVWFTGMDITNSNTQSRVRLQGLSRNEATVATLMERLEHIQSLSQIRLVLSEQVNEKDVYKKEAYSNVPLIRFEIRFNAKE